MYCTTLVLHHSLQEYSHPLSFLRCLCLLLPWLKLASSPVHLSLFYYPISSKVVNKTLLCVTLVSLQLLVHQGKLWTSLFQTWFAALQIILRFIVAHLFKDSPLAVIGFEPWTSGLGWHYFANWAITTAMDENYNFECPAVHIQISSVKSYH